MAVFSPQDCERASSFGLMRCACLHGLLCAANRPGWHGVVLHAPSALPFLQQIANSFSGPGALNCAAHAFQGLVQQRAAAAEIQTHKTFGTEGSSVGKPDSM